MQSAPPELPPGPNLENLRGPAEAASGNPSPLLIALLLLLSAAAILLSLWLILRRRRSKPQTGLPPCDAAAQILQNARQSKDDGELAAHASQAVRTCLDTILPPTTAATTAELAGQLESAPVVDNVQVHQFLQSCDSVKFSGRPLSAEQRIEILDTAGSIIDRFRQAGTGPEQKPAQR